MKFRALLRRDRIYAAFAAVATIAILGAYSRFHPTEMKNFVWEADSWLRGSVALVHFPGDFIDAVPFHGRAYVYEAPLPAVLLLPFVKIWGLQTNQTLLAIALDAVAVAAGWLVARRAGVSERWTLLLVAFLLLGTSLAFCGANGDVWYIAHCGSVAFTLLAVCECLGTRRPWLIAFWALAAAFCRYPMFLALPAYAAFAWPNLRRRGDIVAAACVIVPVALLSTWFNWVRWGTLADIGFFRFYRTMDIGRHDPSPAFALKNIPMQLYFYLREPPALSSAPPFIVARFFGTALTFTSPALAIAVLAPWRERSVQLLWFATACCTIPALLYYSTGMAQLGARHALDFIPFLYTLMSIAVAQRPRWWYVVLLVWSIAFGAVNLGFWLNAPDRVPH